MRFDAYQVPEMKRIKWIHFVGIGGSGMSGIAEVLLNQGYKISGSDISEGPATKRLAALGVLIKLSHDALSVSKVDLVVVSSAIRESNVEIKEAQRSNIPVIQRAVMLGELMRYRHGIAIAGTHGKTTTTSMLAEILRTANLSPTFVIGGILNSAGSGAVLGSGQHIVVEADESDGSFLELQPMSSVITNIDRDHMSTYNHDFGQLKDSFVQFANNLPFYGSIALCVDDPNVVDIIPRVARRVLSYGFSGNAIFQASNLKINNDSQWSFKVVRGDLGKPLQIRLPIPGHHNVRNALAAVAVATDEGVDDQAISEGLSGFSGVGRRFQVTSNIIFDGKAVVLVDDYGHHPTEVEAVIETAKSVWPNKNINMIYQPHRFSRTWDLFEEFVRVLSEVDNLMLLDVYSAGEEEIAGANSRSLAEAIYKQARLCPAVAASPEDAIDLVKERAEDGDVLIVQGAGNVSAISNYLRSQVD